LFLVQQLEMVLQEAGRIPGRLHLGQVNVIDNGDGKAIASLLNAYPEMVKQFLHQSESILGIPLTRRADSAPASVRAMRLAALSKALPVSPKPKAKSAAPC
jgi:uncharacterized membrane protein YqiK